MNRKNRTNRHHPFLLPGDIPFWMSLVCWSLLPSTKVPLYKIESVPISLNDLICIGLAGFYWLLPGITSNSLKFLRKPWHCYLPLATINLLIYAAFSVEWSGIESKNARGMLYTLLSTAGAFFLGFYLIQKRSLESIRPFLWKLTIFLALVGLFYTANSLLSLGFTTAKAGELEDFGIARVKGPLFGSTTGFFMLMPALAFAIQEFFKNPTQRLFKLAIIISFMVTIIGLGSRYALILLALFSLLLILSLKNAKQAISAFLLIVVVAGVAGFIIFFKAKTDRLQSLEENARLETHLTSFQIIYVRDDTVNFFGSGYGSYWHWYMDEMDPLDPEQDRLMDTPFYYHLVSYPYGVYGNILYHPHSTFLLLVVELGVPGLLYFLLLWGVLIALFVQNFIGAEFPILNCGLFASGCSIFFDFFLFKGVQVSFIWWLFLFGALALNYGGKKKDLEMVKPANSLESSKK